MTELHQEQQTSKRVIVKSQIKQPEVFVSRLAESNAAIHRATIDPSRLSTRDVVALQRTMGNHAVTHLLGRSGNSATPLGNALVQRTAAGGFETEGDFESRLNRSKGSGGVPLPDHLRADLEPKFGADFGQVRIHTNNQSDLLNRSIQAKAFTTGNDIFFRKGAYNPKSSGGKQLLAHELTHTVQQGAAPIQRQPSASIAHELTRGGQQLGGVVQRVDEIIPLEDYGDLAIPKKRKSSKKSGPHPRNAKPTNRMKPAEDKATVAERLSERATSDTLAQQSDDIGELYAHAQMLQAFYDHTLGHVAEWTNGKYMPGPIKELGRTMDKVTTDYTDKKTGVQRPELVKDLLRSSIVFDNAQDLVEAVKVIKTLEHREPSIKIRNLKNKFSGSGYGDINMSMEIGDGYIGELQLHLAKFWEIKTSKGDHHLYEQISQLERAKQSRKLKPKEEIKLKQLKASQNKTYADALSTEADPENAIKELSSISL